MCVLIIVILVMHFETGHFFHRFECLFYISFLKGEYFIIEGIFLLFYTVITACDTVYLYFCRCGK
ncbi:hypothetical protein BDF14DRAFT_1827489 [Spinellus fusiger]|nr:hypothetical protein BDF14DRAFT_1827489 [Spinellus fusiger]